VEQRAAGYHYDMQPHPGFGFVEYALGPGQRYAVAHEVEIRSARRNAGLMPDNVPIVLIHGTHDDNVDIRHSVELYARLLACGKQAQFYAIAGGNHGLGGAEAEDENTRDKATHKYAAAVFAATRRASAAVWPAAPTVIPVTGGRYEVCFAEAGATLRHVAES
jgi:hypothetical protein